MSKEKRGIIPFQEGILHVLFWLLVIHFLFDVGGLFHAFLDAFIWQNTKRFDEALLLLPLGIGLFYWNEAFLIPKWLRKGRWVLYCFALLASYLLFYFFAACLYEWLAQSAGFFMRPTKQEFLDQTVETNLLIVIASTALGIAKIASRNLALKKAAEEKQKEAELKYLANQFNPHFLYNTLNGIYAKAIEEDAPQTTEAIVRLSEIMRYPINQGLKREVLLTEEVAFIKDFIALQKNRIGEDYPVRFEQEGRVEGRSIIPLSLIILVENAFKYGVSQKDKSPITFHLRVDARQTVFTAKNSIKAGASIQSHQIGLQNLTDRLRLRYDDRYSLRTTQEGELYTVVLEVFSEVGNMRF